jgi:uncharacterized membrane protein
MKKIILGIVLIAGAAMLVLGVRELASSKSRMASDLSLKGLGLTGGGVVLIGVSLVMMARKEPY